MNEVTLNIERLFQKIEECADRLQGQDPNNELPKFSDLITGKAVGTSEQWDKFAKLFQPMENVPNIMVVIAYIIMLEDALDQID